MTSVNSTRSRQVCCAVIVVCCVFSTSALHANESATSQPDASSLVQRGAIRLKLAGAQRAMEAALAKAAEMKLSVNIAIVDEGGNLMLFTRMDGARPASAATAMTKATTAAMIRAETGPLMVGEVVNTHLSLAIENAAAASGGKFTTLKGGVPLTVDDQIIGAMGVGGATGEQDQEIARTAARALAEAAASERQ